MIRMRASVYEADNHPRGSFMAEQLDDSGHPVRLTSPLGKDLVVHSMTGVEEIGRLYEFNLQLLSMKNDIDFNAIIGKRITVTMDLASGERHFDGYVTQFRYTGGTARYSSYEATVRPWLWFLTRTADCRIFQDMTVPDIIKQVFRDNGMSDFDERFTANYRNWTYCTQYRETDFNFVSRLMEQEGIYYFFEHVMGKHTLVLADDKSSLKPFPGAATVPYSAPTGDMSLQQKDHIQLWTVTQAIQSGKYAIADYDFEKPKVGMLSKLSKNRDFDYAIPDPEIFDYPGEYVDIKDGDNYVEVRLHELQSQHKRVQGAGPVRTIAAGAVFTLEDHPRSDQNKEYLVVSVLHELHDANYVSGGSRSELYRCQMEVMEKTEPFRTLRSTPKPVVQGCQSAVVVGPSSDEIYTDEYGRVKVQFHWDRYGKNDQNSSCWVRVSQAWAGKGWGSMHIPRIGQEVIVSFMEGDPDRPVVTGRLYNAENMPPWELEANKTQSGFMSRSTKGGGAEHYNGIRMEDKIGEEEFYLQAEKDENILVKNDKSEEVGNNETVSIGNDRQESVGHNESLSVGNDRTRDVAENESVSVGANRTHGVGDDEKISVGKNQTVTIGEKHTVNVTKGQDLTVGEGRSMTIGKALTVNVGENESRDVAKNFVLNCGDSLLLKCGSASISLKENGNIVVKGTGLTFDAQSKIDAKASGAVTINGSKVNVN